MDTVTISVILGKCFASFWAMHRWGPQYWTNFTHPFDKTHLIASFESTLFLIRTVSQWPTYLFLSHSLIFGMRIELKIYLITTFKFWFENMYFTWNSKCVHWKLKKWKKFPMSLELALSLDQRIEAFLAIPPGSKKEMGYRIWVNWS